MPEAHDHRQARTAVSEGGAATFTITADQAPVKDTSVNYQVVGTAQPGSGLSSRSSAPRCSRPARRSVTVTLRSIQKDVVFEPTDMIVGNWPIRIGQVFVKEGDPVPPGTPVLSLTEPNFTVTLQASASDRTKLKVGQHCTVELVGGENEEPGTISELDSNQTDARRDHARAGRRSRCTRARSRSATSARPTARR